MKRVLTIFLTVIVAIGVFTTIKNLGWLSFIGIESETKDSQVIEAIERTQEVSLLKLGIQGILEKNQNTEIAGVGIPGTGESVFIQYNFTAKLGIDGADVEVTKTGDKTYAIAVPEFKGIGFDDPTFKVAVKDSGVLSWVTPDIDQLELVNEVLDDDAKSEYVESNTDLLKDQTQVFYDGLIKSVIPDAETSYEFAS